MTVKVEPISLETRTLATRVLFKSARFLLKVSHERNKIFHGVDARGVIEGSPASAPNGGP